MYHQSSSNPIETNILKEYKRYIIDETMDQLFDSLDHIKFYRINRVQIISKTAIQ